MGDFLTNVLVSVVAGVVVYSVTQDNRKNKAVSDAISNRDNINAQGEQAKLLTEQEADFYTVN